jgi:hypothetical protein
MTGLLDHVFTGTGAQPINPNKIKKIIIPLIFFITSALRMNFILSPGIAA